MEVSEYLLDLVDNIMHIILCELLDSLSRHSVGKVQIVSREGRVLELFADFSDVFIGATDEENGLEMHQFFSGNVVDHIYEEYLFLQDLSSRVDHRNND